MTARTFSQLITLVVVTLCFHTSATAQARRDTPMTSLTVMECALAKGIPTATLQETSNQALSGTPIPSNGLVKVSDMDYNRYSVVDSQGEIWVAGPGTYDRTIDLGHLPSGVYYLHLTSENGEVVRKVLKGK